MFPAYASGLYSTGPIAAALIRPRQFITDLIRRSGLEHIGNGRAVEFVDVALVRQVYAWTSSADRSGFGMGLRDAGSLANALRDGFLDAVHFGKTLDDLVAAAPMAQAWRDQSKPYGWDVAFYPTYASFAASFSGFTGPIPPPDRRVRFDGIVVDIAWSLHWVSQSLTPHTTIT